MIRHAGVRALACSRLQRPPLVRAIPSCWTARFASSTSSNSTDGVNHKTSSDSKGSPTPFPDDDGEHLNKDLNAGGGDAAPPDDTAGAAEAVDAVQDTIAQASSSVGAVLADSGITLVHGTIQTVRDIQGVIQFGVEGMHAITGLPWWATIATVTVCVKVSMLPVVVYQAGHADRLRGAWPEIQILRGHLASTLEQIPQRRFLARWRKYRVFFTGCRGLMGLHGSHPLGLVATTLVNVPVFIMFVWSIRGMLRDAKVQGLSTGGMLWFTDLTVPDSSLALPIIWTICTYTGVELSKMKGATGWIKFFQDGMQTFMILLLPWISTFPQGVFMYSITSSVFGSCQTLSLRTNTVRDFLGLQRLGVRPPAPHPVSTPTKTITQGANKGAAVLGAGDSSASNGLTENTKKSDREIPAR